MVNLKEIRKTNDEIRCKAFVEDCQEAVTIRIDHSGELIEKPVLPAGYEWCSGHISHARWYLESLWKETNIPDHELIMWY